MKMANFETFPILPIILVHRVVNSVLALITYIVVGLRLYMKKKTKVGLDRSDTLALLAVPQDIALLAIHWWWAFMGAGYSVEQTFGNLPIILKPNDFPLQPEINWTRFLLLTLLPPPLSGPLLQLLLAYELLYITSMGTTKAAALLFYLRTLIGPHDARLRIAAHLALWLAALLTAANIMQVLLLCEPLGLAWDPLALGAGRCGGDLGASMLAVVVSSMATDFVVLAVPLPAVWRLKVKVGTKVGLTAVFLLGLLTSIVAVVRTYALTKVDLYGNITGTVLYVDFLTTLEATLAVLCTSLPMVAPLWTWCAAGRSRGRKRTFRPTPSTSSCERHQ
ncbi:hypothetical protein BX600DRAFT_527321 [Xylariales sp. PMI_506]|nr:hypothetical protein BX600DRAFT_527321 [Xylariales sp. PMI_506]